MINIKDIPNTVKVGGNTYYLRKHDSSWGEDTQLHGKCDANMLEIHVVTEGLPRDVVRNTIIHELLHALYREYDIQEDDDEERTVTKLANGICQLTLDNPWLKDV